MKKISKKITTVTPTPLYHQVFSGKFTCVVVFLLLCSFLLQPIERVYASETTAEPQTTAPVDTAIVSNYDTSHEAATASLPPEPVPPDVTADTAAEPLTPVLPSSEVTATTSTSTPPDSNNSTNSTNSTDDTDDVDVNPPEDISIFSDASSTLATTSGEVVQVQATLLTDEQIQFDKKDCVSVADGSYYCRAKISPDSETKDGLFSQPDSDGDLEIYLARAGELIQITHNTVDDASPFFDAKSDTIVWHRQINDRYQIVSYDIQSGAESQITTDTVNNMEPGRFGTYTVWQHWNVDNWDIMLYDGNKITLLTDTPQHDIAPTIRGELVIWNRLTDDNVQTIELYDLTTHEYTTINDNEGGALSNPRMVLVYDAQFANGDIITKGYNVETGEITALHSLPVPTPSDIPEPDTTGETRALIQAKNTAREDSEQVLPPDPKIDPPTPDGGVSTATSTMTLTVASSSDLVPPNLLPPLEVFTLDLSTSSAIDLSTSSVTTLQ